MTETRDTRAYFADRGLRVKIDTMQVIALYRGMRGIGLDAYEDYIKDAETRHAPWKSTIREPIIIDADLAQQYPFGTKISLSIQTQIEAAIEKQAAMLGEFAAKIKSFQHRKLTTYDAVLRKKHKRNPRFYYRDRLYAMWRWNVAKRVMEQLNDFGVTISEVLALYQTEGDLNIPLSLEAMHYQLEPNPLIKRNEHGRLVLYEPYGDFSKNYHGRHQTFYVQKKIDPVEGESLFQEEVSTVIKSRSYMLDNVDKDYFYPKRTPAMVLSASKENANQYYLSALAGLDFYMHNIWPARINKGELRQLLTYQYARYHIKAGSEAGFQQLCNESSVIYDQITAVKPEAMQKGEVWSNSIICTILRTGIMEKDEEGAMRERLRHHLFPVNPVDYVSFIISLGVIRLEAFRRDSLIFGGIRFNSERPGGAGGRYEPLPLSLAYIRYNMWDIHFAVIVLDALYKILHKTPINSRTPQYIKNLYTGLKAFRRPGNSEVWTVLGNWYKKDNYLRTKEVTKRRAIRTSIYNDAKSDQVYILGKPGENELAVIKKLNEKGHTDTIVPLLDALTTNELWGDLSTAIYSQRMLRSNLKYKHHIVDYKNRFLKQLAKFKKLDE